LQKQESIGIGVIHNPANFGKLKAKANNSDVVTLD